VTQPSDDLSSPSPEGFSLSRRHALVRGGVVLIGGLAAGCTTAPPAASPRTTVVAPAVGQTVVVSASPPTAPLGRVTAANGGIKPVYLAEAGTRDPVAHSLAETLFWTDVFMEHAKFFVMLMPGPELAGPRSQAEQFQATFARHVEQARAVALDRTNFATFNRSTIDLVQPFIQFKRQMQDAQASGRLGSLVWPLFFDHTAREAERLVQRLGHLSRGVVELDRREVSAFWTRITSDHAAFIAHLLDPQEFPLIDKALQTARSFKAMHDQQVAGSAVPGDPVLAAAQEVVDFKMAAERGIQTGQIKSIIPLALADHVRREGVKFVDELRRAV
jgi:hypothetical protein